jgi:uncharacterized membrane protein (DUF2068 family)
MTTDPVTTANTPAAGDPPVPIPAKPQHKLLHLPGVMAIAAYMLLLAVVAVVGVVGRHFPIFFLLFSVLFFAAGFGLFLLLRWAWALTLAAVAMLAGLFLYNFSMQHSFPALTQGFINLIIFLYLVRTDIRDKLR